MYRVTWRTIPHEDHKPTDRSAVFPTRQEAVEQIKGVLWVYEHSSELLTITIEGVS